MNRCGAQLCLVALTVTFLSPCLGGESKDPGRRGCLWLRGRWWPAPRKGVVQQAPALLHLLQARPTPQSPRSTSSRWACTVIGGMARHRGPWHPLGWASENRASFHRLTPRPCLQVRRAVLSFQDL